MLEIDKIQSRFPASAQQILNEYARDLMKSSDKKEIPPNPPIAPDNSKELFDPSIVKSEKAA